MAGLFTYQLEDKDGKPVTPPVLHTAVPTWRAGDSIPLGAGRTLIVVEVRPTGPKEEPVLVVEAM